MKKILFYAANGVGLGHLKRTCLVAEELKSKDIKIILVTPACSPYIFGKFFHYLIELSPLSDELLSNPSKTLTTRLSNGKKLTQVFKKFNPDLVVADFYLASPFTFSAFATAIEQFPIKSVFIWRLGDKKSICYDFKNEINKLDYFQKIILPHSLEELEYLLPNNLLKKIKNNQKFGICGLIYQKLNKRKISECRCKYKISSEDFLITLTLGGGGKLKAGQCDAPDKIIKNFSAIYSKLADKIPNLKAIIITGPYFKNLERKSSLGLKFVRFEKNLLELIKLSKIIISPAGYNICNEFIQAKTPAILIPLRRGNNEQFERADYLRKKGVVKVFNSDSQEEFLDLIMNCKENLNKMKSNFKNFSRRKQGNNKAAKIILNLLK